MPNLIFTYDIGKLIVEIASDIGAMYGQDILEWYNNKTILKVIAIDVNSELEGVLIDDSINNWWVYLDQVEVVFST